MFKSIQVHAGEYRIYLRCEAPDCIAETQATRFGPMPKPEDVEIPDGWRRVGGRVLCRCCADPEYNAAMIASVCGSL